MPPRTIPYEPEPGEFGSPWVPLWWALGLGAVEVGLGVWFNQGQYEPDLVYFGIVASLLMIPMWGAVHSFLFRAGLVPMWIERTHPATRVAQFVLGVPIVPDLPRSSLWTSFKATLAVQVALAGVTWPLLLATV